MFQQGPARMSLDGFSSAWYDLTFRYKYSVAEGDEFQSLFVGVMERAHPGDFTKVQPWGNIGDKKCDGYLASERMVFGCYGPKEFSPLPRAVDKVRGDHAGAVLHWKPYMDAWTFVHNDHHGLPPDLLQTLEDLKGVDIAVTVTHWGLPELEIKVRGLNASDLVALFGAAPTGRDVMAVRQEDLRHVLPALAGALAMAPVPLDLRPVPPQKLEFNQLSDQGRLFLTLGMQVSDRVRQFFDRWEPGVGDRITAGFNARYQELRADGTRSPDEILWSLYEFAGRDALTSTREHSAVVALLAFLFEACEIFERPGQMASS